ncbi:MAG: CehA/McbA family metallohydrolase [Deltaproteobacteria bacterium]|nr:CehA/McbA family metallohydrolase [Deltaproteobacteria bacterium]
MRALISSQGLRWLAGAFLAAGVVRGCACSKAEEAQPAPTPLPLDEPLLPGQVRAGLVSEPSELIGGPAAKGRVGDYKIYNDQIQVLIGQPGLARGYNPYGGNVIDADVVRPAGEAGRSRFGEVIVATDLFILDGQQVEVVSDGRDGVEARIRATGRPADMPLFSAFFSELFGQEPYDLEWQVDYVLEPGARWVRCEYELFNPGRQPVEIGLPAAGFIFDSARPFVEGYGFDPPDSDGTGAYYGALGEDVSYIYGDPDDRLNVIITDSGVVFAGMGAPLKLRAKERLQYVHYLVVGDGDLARTQDDWRQATGAERGAEITGVVKDSLGAPVPYARVHVLEAEPRVAERDYRSRTRADDLGRFSVREPEGRYRLIAVTPGLTVSPAVEVEAGATGEVALSLSRPGVLRYHVKDDGGRDLPVKLSIRPVGQGTPNIPARFGELGIHYGLTRTVFAETGVGEVELPAGDYEVFVSRGVEYEIAREAITVAEGETVALQAELRRSVQTTGWLSSDTHIHAQLSPDSPDTYEDKVRAMVVENLELPVSTEHEAIGDFNPAIEALGVGSWMHGIVGSEVTTYIYGHFNAFPLVPDFTKPGNGRIDWYGKPPAETFAAVHANPGQPFLQVNHPRATAIGGYFSAMGYDRETGVASHQDWSPDFDGIEVMNGCSGSGVQAEEVKDWFSFLNQGRRVTGVGSTDNHRAEGGAMGLPLSYVHLGTDDPQAVSDDAFRAAFMEGRVVVTCGPFLTAALGEADIGDVARVSGDLVTLDVYAAAPTWMDVDRLQVIVNGEVVKTLPLEAPVEGTVRFSGTVTASVAAGQDGWVVVSVDGDRNHGIWARGRPSFAFTNPIFLDGDGDGAWTMR